MKNFTFILFALFFTSCGSNSEVVLKQYFNHNFKKSLNAIIEIDNFKSYEELLKKMEEKSCEDSIPTLNFNKGNLIKEVNVFTNCWKNYPPLFDPKNRNTIYFKKGVLIKNDKEFKIDSLESILKKDYNNYGENPNFADNPEKLGIIISDERSEKVKSLKNILNEITKAYDNIKTNKSLNIMITNYIEIPPLPPVPD